GSRPCARARGPAAVRGNRHHVSPQERRCGHPPEDHCGDPRGAGEGENRPSSRRARVNELKGIAPVDSSLLFLPQSPWECRGGLSSSRACGAESSGDSSRSSSIVGFSPCSFSLPSSSTSSTSVNDENQGQPLGKKSIGSTH